MGHDEYELKSLADAELLSGLACIVGRRNQITAEFLAYLAVPNIVDPSLALRWFAVSFVLETARDLAR